MPKEIKGAFCPPVPPTAWCEVPDTVGFMFRLFASVSSRIPFDVHDERLESVWEGLEDRAGASHSLGSGQGEGTTCWAFGPWLLCPAVPRKSEFYNPHPPFPYIHISPAIMTLLPDSPSGQWRPMNRGKWGVNLEVPVPLGDSSHLLGLCSPEMRSLGWPETLANHSPISNLASLKGGISSL